MEWMELTKILAPAAFGLFGAVAGLLWTERQRQKNIAHEANLVRRGISAELAYVGRTLDEYWKQLNDPATKGKGVYVACDFGPSFFETALPRLAVLSHDEIGPALNAFHAKTTFLREVKTHGIEHPSRAGYYFFLQTGTITCEPRSRYSGTS